MTGSTSQYPKLSRTDIENSLNELGFKLSDKGSYWQTYAIWRNGDNPTAIQIYKNSGVWRDFVNDTGHQPFARLVGNVLGTRDPKRIQKYVNAEQKEANFIEECDNRVTIKMDQIYELDWLDKLLPHHKFYLDKGISLQTLKLYRGGYATSGKMFGRYTFPIFQDKHSDKIVGFTGRSLRYNKDSNFPKWKHIGQRRNWLYPIYLPTDKGYIFKESIESSGEVIIVESVGDSLALTENGILNHAVTFGLGVSSKLICELVSLNPSKIIISYNNDSDKPVNIGLDSSIRDFLKLTEFFNLEKLMIKLPIDNDFSDMHMNKNFIAWQDRTFSQEKQLKHILKKLESPTGKTIIPNSKKLQSKINFLKNYLNIEE